jgi:hypothetical protein
MPKCWTTLRIPSNLKEQHSILLNAPDGLHIYLVSNEVAGILLKPLFHGLFDSLKRNSETKATA